MRGLIISLAVKEMRKGRRKAVIREGVLKLGRQVCSAHPTGVVCNILGERPDIDDRGEKSLRVRARSCELQEECLRVSHVVLVVDAPSATRA